MYGSTPYGSATYGGIVPAASGPPPGDLGSVTATTSVTSAGSLNTDIRCAASITAAVTASAALATGIRGAMTATVTGSASLTTGIKLAAGGGAPIVISLDTFTDTDGTQLTAHTPDSGPSWSVNTAPSEWTIQGNRLARTASVIQHAFFNSGETDVTLTIHVTRVENLIGLLIRRESVGRYWELFYDNSTRAWQMSRVFDGPDSFQGPPLPGSNGFLTIKAKGNVLTVIGPQGHSHTVTDATLNTATGVGIILTGLGSATSYVDDWTITKTQDQIVASVRAAGAMTASIRLVAALTASVTTNTPNLITRTQFAASPTATATATGSMVTDIRMQGAATATATAAPPLTTQIPLDGALTGTATLAPATLATSIRATAAITATTTTTAALSTAIRAQAAAQATVAAQATLSTQILLTGQETAQATISPATLTTSIRMAAAPTATATTSAALLTAIRMAGGATHTLQTQGNLATSIRIAGALAGAGDAGGALLTSIHMTVAPIGAATVTAPTLTFFRPLAGAVVFTVTSTGGILTLESDERYTHIAYRWYVVEMRARDYEVVAQPEDL